LRGKRIVVVVVVVVGEGVVVEWRRGEKMWIVCKKDEVLIEVDRKEGASR